MIIDLAHKLITTYDNLSPKRKALADMLGLLFTIFICVGTIFVAARYNLVFEFAMCMLAYGIFGMVHILYKARVSYYETQERFKR